QDRRVRQELPLVADEEAEQPELVRRQLHRLAAEPHRLLLEVDAQLPDVVHGLGRRLDAAHRGTQARKQLLDAEGLRHVVVGARVERGHLLALVADDRKNDDGDAAPRAQLAADVGAASVRQDEIENDGVGWRERRRCQRALGRVGSVDVVARAAKARLQRAQDVRLVIDDEDATAHVPGRLSLPPGGAGLRERLTTLAARSIALGARSYSMYCPSRLALGSLATAAPGTCACPTCP